MNNLFSFEYETRTLTNKDNTASRFSVVYGEGGNVMHTKKDTYHVVGTGEVSQIGQAFIDSGLTVNSFTHKNGEVIGLNIKLIKDRLTVVGDKNYNAIITIPNNGGGKGYLSINELRLVCTNGMTRNKVIHEERSIKIPHTINYDQSLKLMQEAIISFKDMIEYMEQFDISLNDSKIGHKHEAMRHLNYWFYHFEMPINHKKTETGDNMDFDKFRELLAVNPESIKSIERYNELKDAFNKELEYNDVLGLDLSLYTVYASVTNYLSRRKENSNSTAPSEIQGLRQAKKMTYFDTLVTV